MDSMFDVNVNRSKTNDLKWNHKIIEKQLHCHIKEDMIPMWVADTDFSSAPVVREAIEERAKLGAFGYCAPTEDFYKSICFWHQRRFGFKVKPEWIVPLPSVVSGINIAIRTITTPGEGVIIQPPVYDPFKSLVIRTERTLVNNPLICRNGRYEMDFEGLEKIVKDKHNKLLVLCSPHNPVGRVWEKEELERLYRICRENGVTVVSDEIHSDIVYSGFKHTPLLTLRDSDENQIIHLSSPGKSFNIPGLKMGYAIIPDTKLRKGFETTQLSMSLDIRNTFGIEAISAAYSLEGEKWLEDELVYLENNVRIVENFLGEHMPKVKMYHPEATFLCWLDLSEYNLSDDEIIYKINIEAGVICIPGPWFGVGGEQHLRLNIGCTKANLEIALTRIKLAIK